MADFSDVPKNACKDPLKNSCRGGLIMISLPEEKANPCGSSRTDLCGPSHRFWTCGEHPRTPDHSLKLYKTKNVLLEMNSALYGAAPKMRN